jgi:hypothetical protein
MTTRTATSTPTHDARHCGHVGRSESAAAKRALILRECEVQVEGFTVPADEPADVMALLAVMRAGATCDRVAEVVALVEWHGVALDYADATGEPWLVAPAGGLRALLPA